MIKIIAGLILGMLIGAACRWFDVPLPGPPRLVGVLIIASITVGYMTTDKLIAGHFSAKGPAFMQEMCGGPTGDVTAGPFQRASSKPHQGSGS